MTTDGWDPGQYERFGEERAQPFYDLAALVEREPGMRVIDLGCGNGKLTAWLHERLQPADLLGIDQSPRMLAEARAHARGTLRFEQAEIDELNYSQRYDLVFSNAVLQWLPDHASLFPRLSGLVAPGGQFAVQMPVNRDHPAQRIPEDLGKESPFREVLGGDPVRAEGQLPVRDYAEILAALGYADQHVRLQIYGHWLPSAAAAVEWQKGSQLTAYAAKLPEDLFERFVAIYRERFLAAVGDKAPYFYSFPRVLIWGRKPR